MRYFINRVAARYTAGQIRKPYGIIAAFGLSDNRRKKYSSLYICFTPFKTALIRFAFP